MLAATQANAALVLFEGFETGLGAWTPQSYIHPDAIGLFDPTFTRTTERAESGNWSLNASANGFNADGTFWLEQPVNLPAGTWNIVLSFQLWSPTQSEINNWEVVASVGTINPEVEEDLIELGETNRDGTWIYYELDRTITLDQPGTVYTALGLNIVYNDTRTYGFDSTAITIVPAPAATTALLAAFAGVLGAGGRRRR